MERERCLAGEGEDAGADDGAETEPDEIPLGEASLHGVLALLAQIHQLVGFGGSIQEAVLEAGRRLTHRRLVIGAGIEGRLRVEILLAPSPVPFSSSRGFRSFTRARARGRSHHTTLLALLSVEQVCAQLSSSRVLSKFGPQLSSSREQ
ncbi:hypothetical protein AKJ16_DCAP16679 [Drosera capensis]